MTPEECLQAASDLRELQGSPGWALVMHEIDILAQQQQDDLYNIDPAQTGIKSHEISATLATVRALMLVKTAPTEMITAFTNAAKATDEEEE